MKAIEFKIPRDSINTIHAQHDMAKRFFESYHIHNELQLTYIKSGTGLAHIGDAITGFKPSDVFLIGANLPHVFKSDQTSPTSESYSFFFINEFLGKDFLELESSRPIKSLLEEGNRGIKLEGSLADKIGRRLQKGMQADSLTQQLLLLGMLTSASRSSENQILAGPAFGNTVENNQSSRISTVLEFLTSNYQKHISLNTIAEVANLSPTAFCRYFKLHTGKTYTGFLIEVRLSQACKKLLETDDSVANICFDCGFNNLSNFNRLFKKHMGMNPRQFKRSHINQTIIFNEKVN